MEDKALSLEGAKTLYNDLRSRIVGLSGSGESPNITVDSQTSTVSTNPVENRVITKAVNDLESKVDTNKILFERHLSEFNDWKDGIDVDAIFELEQEVDTLSSSIKKLDDDLTKDIQTNKTYIDTQVNSLSVSVDSKLSNISYNSLKNTPNLATVALSGNFDDLTTKPVIPEKSTGITETDNGYITGSMIYNLLGNEASYDSNYDSGFAYLNNGMLLQWGTVNASAGSQVVRAIYPISYMDKPILAFAYNVGSTSKGFSIPYLLSAAHNSSSASQFENWTNVGSQNTSYRWYALGF